MKLQKETGQTLLIVVLIMVVALTVGLSVASRSIVNLRTSVEEENSQRAFSAAEAGIERVLKTNTGITAQDAIDLGNNSTIKQVQILPVSGTEFLGNGGNPILKDDGVDIWLANQDSNGTIDYVTNTNARHPDFFTIYWGSSSDNCQEGNAAAMEIIVISGTSNASLASKKYAFDPCPGRRTGNNFSAPDTTASRRTAGGKTFPYNTPTNSSDKISISNGILVRVIPIYANTSIGISTCNPSNNGVCNNPTALPSQGKQIESTGVSGTTSRKVTLFQGYPSLPAEFFQYVLFCTKQTDSGCSGL